MTRSRFGVAIFVLLFAVSTSAMQLVQQYGSVGIVTYDLEPVPIEAETALARQCGAFGIITYDPLPDPTASEAYTRTSDVPVPYEWLLARVPDAVHEYYVYEAAAKATAANGRKVWECYLLDLDPSDPLDDFKITSLPMKTDGTPDFANMTFEPARSRWNVSGATPKLMGAATPEGPWSEVPSGGDSSMKFFKVAVELPR